MKKFSLFSLLTITSSTLFAFPEFVQAQVQVTSPSQVSSVEIPHINDLKKVVTHAAPLLTQVLQVTGVKLDATATGVEVVLETATGDLPKPITTTENNTLIIDIPNTVLALPEGKEFRSENPALGIELISITQNNTNGIRISITGETTVPTAEITANGNGLVLSVIPGENQPDIEITVTGNPDTPTVTKTDTPIRDLPFSVQVVPQQVIQDQRTLNVGEAVKNISGFALSGRGGGRNESSLLTRGFTADQFRDGFSEGNNANRVFTEISNLERIEVLKGPAATLYGQSEPGGIVNLVTKKPLANPFYQAEYIGGSFGFNRGNLDLTGPLDSNRPFAPERGSQYEVGVKADWFDGRLSSTLAFYQITKTNVLVTDPIRPTFFIQTGEQRSRGVELDLVGEILPGWNVITSYAYTDAIITNDTTFPEGNSLANVPRNALSFWTSYTIPRGDLQGLGFGAGVFLADSRPGDLNNSFTLSSYTRVDAAIYYNYGNFRAALNIKNLFDTRYFESAQSRTAIYPGAPLTVLGTISLQF